MRYAWVGINGGMALTANTADTQHLNGAYSFFTDWDIPGSQSQPEGLPANFIAPLWTDLHLISQFWKCDSAKIFTHGDDYRFILEWKNIISLRNDNDCSITFEVVLDRRDSSITVLYKDVGASGVELDALVGLEADTSKWFIVCREGLPQNYLPRFGRALKFLPHTKTQSVNGNRHGQLPVAFSLGQNYPNPFNPSTQIRYQVPEARWVSLKVYNLLGREIATLVDEVKPPGDYVVEWNAAPLSSGVYVYNLRSGSFIDWKKMILMR